MFDPVVYQGLPEYEQEELATFLDTSFMRSVVEKHLRMYRDKLVNLDPQEVDFKVAFVILQTQLRQWQNFDVFLLDLTEQRAERLRKGVH